MKPIARALRLFGRERGLWKYAVKPLAWGVLAYALVLLLTVAVSVPLGQWIAGLFGASSSVGGLIGGIVGFGVAIALGGAIYLGLVALIAGFGFDALSMEVEQRMFGTVKGKPLTFSAGLGDGIARGILALVLGIVALCGSGTVVIPWLVASFLCLLDFTAPSMLRRNVSLGGQFGVARRLPGAPSFALISGVIVLIPVVNVLALPILVAAGTILVAEHDRTGV